MVNMVVNSGKLFIKRQDLNLKLMLEGGQSFRWKRKGDNEWTGVFRGVMWQLTQSEDHVAYTAHPSGTKSSTRKGSKKPPKVATDTVSYDKMLGDYLRVDSPLDEYYSLWSERDDNFKEAAVRFHGLRMLDQDPVENVFSFICSSNNNILRISSMVEKMCELYGEEVSCVEGHVYHGFPSVERLTDESVEQELRTAGFGYRAKFISGTALKLVQLGGSTYLNSLKKLAYSEAKQALLQFPGIGPKVADCICLMSLGHFEAVPVDTHVFQVACQSYLPHLKAVKSVTDRVYKEIGDHFRQLFGPLAGWAHTILFCADLKKFQTPVEKPSSRKPPKRKIKDDEIQYGKRKSEESSDYVPNSLDGESSVIKVEGHLPVSTNQLHLRVTFNCGQTYRWKQLDGEAVWRGVHADRLWTLKQTSVDSLLHFTCHYSASSQLSSVLHPAHYTFLTQTNNHQSDETRCVALLKDYFRLDEHLEEKYAEWRVKDTRFNQVCSSIYGLRMTRQDIVENLFAFICSSNNTISRITSMVEHLCRVYGDLICSLDGVDYYTSPRLERLCAPGVADELRSANFGFRSRYVEEAARAVQAAGGATWFHRLLSADYGQAKNMLMQLPGIGAKVADCICLTALDHLQAVPVDTHVFQMAKKYYLPDLKDGKTVSKRTYERIGSHLRNLFGRQAGWAHTVLFCSELRCSADLLTASPTQVSSILT